MVFIRHAGTVQENNLTIEARHLHLHLLRALWRLCVAILARNSKNRAMAHKILAMQQTHWWFGRLV
jgi:hypothetical protein